MKKILIASPVRGGLSPNYVRFVIALLNSSLCKGPNAQYRFDFAWTQGTSVAMARDEYTNLFLSRDDDELVQLDIDLGPSDPKTFVSMLARLLSHDVDVVGGAYVGHNFLSQWHGASASPDSKMRPDGLLPMAQIPLGFSKVKRRVFEKIKKDKPYLEYVFKETGMKEPRPNMYEFYPNGIVGPTSGQGKVDRIKTELEKRTKAGGINHDADQTLIESVHNIINDNDHSQNIMLGEDFYFCRLARESGFEMFIDNNLLVPHKSSVHLPVKSEILLDVLKHESWRWSENSKPEDISSLVEMLRPHFAQNAIL